MSFIIDKQTFSDLEIFSRNMESCSVFSLFDHTVTKGGQEQLRYMFNHPFTDVSLMKERISIIRYIRDHGPLLALTKESYDFIEYYFTRQQVPQRFSISRSYTRAILQTFRPSNEYYIIQRGIRFLISELNKLQHIAASLVEETLPGSLRNSLDEIINHLNHTPLRMIRSLQGRRLLSPAITGKLDFLFRKSQLFITRDLLDMIYQLDAFQSIAQAMDNQNLSYPEYAEQTGVLEARNLYHPFLEQPVSNSICFSPEQRVCFLTGPNMAGKSTFLKSLGVAVYLSHLGFPVPASSFRTSVFQGLLTTVNLSDNLNKGYSHYYNEVLRVKEIATHLNQVPEIFVIIDEMFRGTNVKDALEASTAVIRAFAGLKRGVFAISSHIVEVAEQISSSPSVFYHCFEAGMRDGDPHYTYELKTGVTAERLGMYILRKEQVVETIEMNQARTEGETLKHYPNLLLIGGNSRNSGKTSLACELIRKCSETEPVVGLKITRIDPSGLEPHGDHSMDSLKDPNILEETNPEGPKDTSRMLQAGAKRVFYIRTTEEHMESDIQRFFETVGTGQPVVCESRALRNFILPGLFIMMVRDDAVQPKSDIDRYLSLADHIEHTGNDPANVVQLAERIRFEAGSWQIERI